MPTTITLTQTAKERHEQAMRSLNPWAVKLHTPLVAGLALLVVGALTTVLFVTSGSTSSTAGANANGMANTLNSIALVLAYIACGAFAAADWHNFTTLHGKINWPLLRYKCSLVVYWIAICLFAMFAFLPAIIYLIQCLQQAPTVRQAERQKLQARIAALEAELRKPLPQ